MAPNRSLLYMAICMLLLQACAKNTDYISNIAASENPFLLQVDTFSAQATIYRPDSFSTADKPVLFAGRYKDPVFGDVTCTPYFRVGLPADASDLTSQTSNANYYDSMFLVLKPKKIYYGDTTATYKLGLYRLSDNITNENNQFYNNHSFAAYPDALGNATVRWYPNGEDSLIRIKLDNSFGKELFDLFRANSTKVTDAAVFLDYLRGFKLVAENGTNTIYGVPNTTDGISLKLYYHNDVGTNQDKVLDFPIVTSTYAFYSVNVNRAGTPLAALDSKTEMVAASMIYNQELTGVKTRISFPYLADLQKNGSFVKVLAAQLDIKPDITRYASRYILPPDISMYYYNVGAALTGPLAATGSSTSQTGSLIIDENFGTNTGYAYDVMGFVNTELTATSFTTVSLVPVIADADNTLYQLVAGMPGDATYKSKLSVSMLVYNKE